MKIRKKGQHYAVDVSVSVANPEKALLVSDLHLDSTNTDTKKLHKMFKEAADENCGIFIFGDFYDVMGMKYDKRSLKSDVLSELKEDDYLFRVAKMGADFLAPYAKNIMLISMGNHEESVNRRIEMSLFELTNLILYRDYGLTVNFTNKYDGFVRFNLKAANDATSKILYYHHGSGGSATMSFGILNVKRQAAVIDADIYVSGHLHNAWAKPLNRMSININGNEVINETIHLQLGAGKDNGSWEKTKRFDWANKSFYKLIFSVQYLTIGLEKGKKKTNFDVIEQRIKL